MTAVYIIDDEPEVRRTMSWLVQSMGCRNYPFASGTDFLDALPGLEPGCMLVDLYLEDLSGIDLIRETAAVRSSFPAVVMSGYANVDTAVAAMKAGALEILQKPISAAQLNAAITLAAEALRPQRPQTLDDCVPALARQYGLTGRQTEVLRALIVGKANKQIAAELSISTRTVEMHRAAVMLKFGVHSLPALLRLVVAATTPGLAIDPGRACARG